MTCSTTHCWTTLTTPMKCVAGEWLDDFPDVNSSKVQRLEGAMGVATWEGVLERMERFLVSPIYGFAASGAMLLAAHKVKTMMRVARAR